MTDLLDKSLLYKADTFKIIGAAMSVRNELGCGFLEAVYQEAMIREMVTLGIPFESQVPLNITFKGHFLEKQYLADFVCYGKIIVELKALSDLNSEHDAQVLNYLKASGYKLGLLINFGQESLKFKRIIKER